MFALIAKLVFKTCKNKLVFPKEPEFLFGRVSANLSGATRRRKQPRKGEEHDPGGQQLMKTKEHSQRRAKGVIGLTLHWGEMDRKRSEFQP